MSADPTVESMRRYKNARKLLKPWLDMLVQQTVIGEDKVPHKGPLLIVANHRSDLDPMIISSAINRYIIWVAAHYTFEFPVIGNFLKELGTIPISSEKRDQMAAFKGISQVIKANRVVGIFPEGHDYILNNDFSKRLGEFQAGFTKFALKLKVDVLPVTIIGVREKVEPWGIPPFIRQFLNLPPEIVHVPNRLNFQEVKVVIGNVMKIDDYLSMKPAEASGHLIKDSREQIMNSILKYGEIERRRDSHRKSGTRVAPEERPSD